MISGAVMEAAEPGGLGNGHAEQGGGGGAGGSGMSASRRRAELRRRKLLLNSEERMNRILGYQRPAAADEDDVLSENRTPHESERLDPPIPSGVSRRISALSTDSVTRTSGSPSLQSSLGDLSVMHSSESQDSVTTEASKDSNSDLRHREEPAPGSGGGGGEHSSRRGLDRYLSRFDEAMKLRNQLMSEKSGQESGSSGEELDSFRLFRLVGCTVLAIAVRGFVCRYLVSSHRLNCESSAQERRWNDSTGDFSPSLKLSNTNGVAVISMHFVLLCFEGEKKMKTTVLTAALLLSGIPAEVISRSMDTYSKMGDVFTDLCVYFFTFIFCHQVLAAFGSQVP
nr:PREDICTED: calcium signal-modulating cyclophilin ligand [Latimeria chalumnae]|eukprot:XP_014343837.1 PREDICTED: calcium signal-modulating cyclophilin ligand [Latimeria chalumnae]